VVVLVKYRARSLFVGKWKKKEKKEKKRDKKNGVWRTKEARARDIYTLSLLDDKIYKRSDRTR
jgi:hypothetical protein